MQKFTFCKNIKHVWSAGAWLILFFFLQSVVLSNTYVVTNTGNTGAGSFRQAIIDANTNPGNDLIIFNLGAGGPFTIGITTVLPNLTDPAGVTIDGWNNLGNN